MEPPLHRAIIDNDLEAFLHLSQDPEAFKEKNSLGFTALELVKLLGRDEFIPRSYKHIRMLRKGSDQASYYTVDEFYKVMGISFIETPRYSSFAFLKQVQSDCPYLLAKTVFGTEQRSLGVSLRKRLFTGFFEEVSIEWIDEYKGYGLFAAKSFPKETYLGEYVGIVRKIDRINKGNEYCFRYPTKLFSFHNYCIDAVDCGNEARFINHSETPNLIPICALDRNLVHIAFFTSRQIAQGEELTFNYGATFWDNLRISAKN
jgi:hypothetical protein